MTCPSCIIKVTDPCFTVLIIVNNSSNQEGKGSSLIRYTSSQIHPMDYNSFPIVLVGFWSKKFFLDLRVFDNLIFRVLLILFFNS